VSEHRPGCDPDPAVPTQSHPSQLGVPPEQARRGAEALLPSILGGMGDNSTALDTHVNALGGAGLAHNVIGSEPTRVEDGHQLLGGIFGGVTVQGWR